MHPYTAVCRDPWDAPPTGLPDDYESHTVPLKIKASYLLNTNDNGSFAFAVGPAIDITTGTNYSVLGTCTAGTSNLISFAGSDHPDAASLVANFNLWRPISAGLKAYYLGAEQTTQGSMCVGHNDNMVPATGTIGTAIPTAIADWWDLPNATSCSVATMTEPLAVAVRAFDAVNFQAFNSVAHFAFFPTMWVAGTNMPVSSTGLIRIECVLNMEAIPLYGNALTAHLQQSFPPEPSVIMMTHRQLGVVRAGPLSSVKPPMSAMRTSSSTKKKGSRKPRKKSKRRAYKRRAYTSSGLTQPIRGARFAKRPAAFQYGGSKRSRGPNGYFQL